VSGYQLGGVRISIRGCQFTAGLVKSVSKNLSFSEFIRGFPPRRNKIKSSEVHKYILGGYFIY